MAFGVTGFAALQLRPQPQVFQALSLGSQPPVPPAPPYGTPNQKLVPVAQSPQTAHLNLTLAAAPVFAAILHVNSTIANSSNASVELAPNSTASVGARNPSVNVQTQTTSNTPSHAAVASGPVSFSLTTAPKYVTSALAALQQTPQVTAPTPALDHELQKAAAANVPAPQAVPSSAPSTPPSSTPQYVLPANGGAIARIVSTVTQLAVSAVYPAPIFSFSA